MAVAKLARRCGKQTADFNAGTRRNAIICCRTQPSSAAARTQLMQCTCRVQALPSTLLGRQSFSPLQAAMSWAKIVQAQPAEKAATVHQAHLEAGSTAVVDTNAIIAGVQLHTLAEQLVTVPEVLAELRDAKSRQALDALPCRLHTREPSEESLAAGALSYPLRKNFRSSHSGVGVSHRSRAAAFLLWRNVLCPCVIFLCPWFASVAQEPLRSLA